MNATPAISILTPFGTDSHIKETIDSVLAEEFQDWELIVGDNESTDGTSEYLRSLTDPRIRVYRHEKNMGVYKNIKFLYAQAKAPIAVGLCADDYFYPGGLKTVIDEWQKATPETAYISFNWEARRTHSYLTEYSYEVLHRCLNR
jgi:glycosyltransferase involved in cell wall biosynthesis